MRLSLESCPNLAVGCLAAFAAFAVVSAAARPGPNPLDMLAVTLRQTSASPPTVRASVTNKNHYAITVLSYQSPLDPLALQLGSLSITPDGSGKPLELRLVKVKRVWPPPENALVVIQPGASATNDMILQEPTVPMSKLAKKAKVVLGGEWIAVWPRSRDQLSDSDIENASGTAFSGPFSTRVLEIEIG